MKHFVLVHGLCHGAWCWYKVVAQLKLAGHRVTAVDMAASGVNPKRLDEINSFSDHAEPLMELVSSLPSDERVILVGHSFGGFGVSLAMEKYPEKIAAAAFVTAFMPDIRVSPAQVLVDALLEFRGVELSDSKHFFKHGPENPPSSSIFGPSDLTTLLYNNCPSEDLELAKMMMREGGFYLEDLGKESLLTEERWGSATRVYVVCGEDRIIPEEVQRRMIDNSPPSEVKVIPGADHMAMLSKPGELVRCLREIAEKHD